MIEILIPARLTSGYDGCCAETCHHDGCSCMDPTTGTDYGD